MKATYGDAAVQRRVRRAGAGVLCALVAAAPGLGVAQDRPSEAEIFGVESGHGEPAGGARGPAKPESRSVADTASSSPKSAPTLSGVAAPAGASPGPQSPDRPLDGRGSSPVSAAPQGASLRDDAILGPESPGRMFAEDAAPEDPLKVGGQVYLRMQSTGSEGQAVKDFAFRSPSLVDVYLDARPNDRVRAFARGRMLYDPTLPSTAGGTDSIRTVSATGSISGSPALSSLFQSTSRDPQAHLDQLWVNFDLWHRVFVTAGKQHVRWGTGRFWAPTDYLHLSPRNPLDVFDARTGTTMVKLHLPIESQQWNFYAYGIAEGPDATPTLSKLAGAVRAELVWKAAELGVGVYARSGREAKLAADLSTGIGDFDFYGEVAPRHLEDIDRVSYDANATIPAAPAPPSWQTPSDTQQARLVQIVDSVYPVHRGQGLRAQAVAGVTYARKYHDNDVFTAGVEYFYNGVGYSGSSSYPGLVLPHSQPLQHPATFFYLGMHYGAVYLSFPAPYSLDNHTFTLSTLGNLSDQSFITRFDYSLVLLTHMRFEAFVSGRYGSDTGEFRFGLKNLTLGAGMIPIDRPAAFIDFGIALRIAI